MTTGKDNHNANDHNKDDDYKDNNFFLIFFSFWWGLLSVLVTTHFKYLSVYKKWVAGYIKYTGVKSLNKI